MTVDQQWWASTSTSTVGSTVKGGVQDTVGSTVKALLKEGYKMSLLVELLEIFFAPQSH